MKEELEMIPVNDAFKSGDECPFCYLERLAEQRTIRYTLGPSASYMEPDVRAETDKVGFCREHMKKMYDYGNALGNALIMQTHYAGLLEELDREIGSFAMPGKRPLFGQRSGPQESSLGNWARQHGSTCFICDRMEYHMRRYYYTFFVMIKNPDFRQLVENGKGYCMRHFARLMDEAGAQVPNSQRQWFYNTVPMVMRNNLYRVKEDLDWFVGMFDYRQAGKDWKNSRDAVSRGMQKLQGLHPTDPPYKQDP